jgi:4-hydroxy-L-threonine phosphate dehydrogenase PdxA
MLVGRGFLWRCCANSSKANSYHSVLGGLPFPFATPAHGTAFDIVGTTTACLEPARRAFLMVCDMAENHVMAQ